MLHGVAAMGKDLYQPLRKLTKRVTGSPKEPKAPSQITNRKMAEQEEDFSSLPLPDRFQHKVILAPQFPDVSGQRTNEFLPLDMESKKSCIRRCCEAVRDYP